MNKSTLIREKKAELNRRRAFKRRLVTITTNFSIQSPATLSACDKEIEAAEQELNHIEAVSYLQIREFPALNFARELGSSLVEGRQALDWSQTKLGEKVGLTRHQVSRYESKQYSHMKLGAVVRIALVIRAALEERRR